MKDIISLRDIKKSYRDKKSGRFEALSGITLNVQAGEAFGFVGPNGAGKSTTMKILTNIIEADSGEARIFGISVSNASARKGMSYVPENPYLYDYLTPIEMMLMGARMHDLPEQGLHTHCMTTLERFGIAHVAKKTIRQFSKGMTQRTALAHALVCKPQLLILDEPLSGLDPIGRKDVVDILTEYRDQGGTIFFASHVLNDVERLGDRFGIIHKGLLRAVDTPAELEGKSDDLRVISSKGDSQIDGMERDGFNQWRVQVNQAELLTWLQRIQSAGHQVMEVRSGGPTLEQAFLGYIAAADQADATGSPVK